MTEIAYLVAESFNAYADSGAPLRLSGTLRERPDPDGRAGAYYYATDQGAVFKSTGKTWVVRGALGKDDVAGRASGLSADMPPSGKMVGWIYHATDTNRDYEAFPSGWYTTIPVNPFIEPGIAPDSLATLRSSFSNQFGSLFQSTGDNAIDAPLRRVIMQTLGASAKNPYLVKFDQIILDVFTGDGQFDLVERDAIRRVFDGVSATGTPILTSATMNFQPEHEGKSIQVGRNPGRFYEILSVEDEEGVTLDKDISPSSTGLTLTMDGSEESEVIIATKDGFEDSDVRLITVDKVYSIVFAPGDTGNGALSLSVHRMESR